MDLTDNQQLALTIERMHNCSARLAQFVPVLETYNGATVWEGMVHVFDSYARLRVVLAYRGER